MAGAKWRTESLSGVSVGHTIHVSLAFQDEALVRAIGKQAGSSRSVLEKEEDGYSVTLSFVVERFTHMVEAVAGSGEASVDSMVWLKPVDRMMEMILLYLLETDACDPKFVQSVRGKAV